MAYKDVSVEVTGATIAGQSIALTATVADKTLLAAVPTVASTLGDVTVAPPGDEPLVFLGARSREGTAASR